MKTIHTKSCPHVFVAKIKNRELKPSPLVGESGGEAAERGKYE